MLPTAKYENVVTFSYTPPGEGPQSFNLTGLNSFYLIRNPLIKIAPIGILTCSVPPEVTVHIDYNIRNSSSIAALPLAVVQIGTSVQAARNMDPVFTNEMDYGNKFDIACNIVHTVSRAQKPSVYGQVVPVTFYLVPMELYEIDKGSMFSDQFRYVRAVDVLDAYQDKIYLDYGHNGVYPFSFMKIGGDTNPNINQFVYEDIYLKSTSDLKIPQLLLSHYKLLNNFGYYFFDVMDKNSRYLGILADLSNPLYYPIFNSHESDKYDLYSQLKLVDVQPMENQYRALRDSMACSYTIRTPESHYMIDKTVSNKYIHKFEYTGGGISPILPPNRTMNRPIINTSPITETIPSGEALTVHSPDNHEQAHLRYNNVLNLLQTESSTFEAIYMLEARDVHVDAIQFTNRYVLDGTDNDGHYIPIAIVNKWLATDIQTKTVEHSVEFQALRYNL